MTKIELTQWLQSQQQIVEKVILSAAEQFVKGHHKRPNFGDDLRFSQQEAYNLGYGKDLCYDRYTTPLAYSVWYQARRMNVFASHFSNQLVEACTVSRPVDIFDLGAGTGCVQFCFGLAVVACYRLKKELPLLRIINVDSSPFMLDYLRSYLWPAAIDSYPELKHMPIEYNVYSWSNRSDISVTNPWICASYLFDSSENNAYLVDNFNELISAFNPAKILLLTSGQTNKRVLMDSLAEGLSRQKKFRFLAYNGSCDVFSGSLDLLTNFRNRMKEYYGLQASSGPVLWSDRSFVAVGLEKNQSGFSFDLQPRPNTLDIFNPPLRIRRNVELNADQKQAAAYDERPSIITGPAGCGKSIVVTEKIINILEKHRWTGPLRILVTTFNISLLKQLRSWVTDLLKAKEKNIKQHYYRTTNNENDGTGKLYTGDAFDIEIEFVHFEMLAKYVGGVRFLPFEEKTHVLKLTEIVTTVREEQKVPSREWHHILTPSFLLEEYHRVIYGMQCRINLGEEAYQEIDRSGRGKQLGKNQRKAVWAALRLYALWMSGDSNAGQSFMARRQLLFNKISSGELLPCYHYLFVDEFQDCTRTDFQIMNGLLHDTNRLVLAGDMAQAVHIGKSGFIPKDADSNKRVRHSLKGSYRLPFRICEAIRPLSQQINRISIEKEATAEISPYKGAPPGARPIVVLAETTDLLAQKIAAVKTSYCVFDLTRITIMEKDEELCKALRQLGMPVETTTILRLKGLEKDCIVWSLQAEIEYEDEVLEFAYTVMTRTNCLLIIAMTTLSKPIYHQVIRLLNEDRLLFWDEQSKTTFQGLATGIEEFVA